MNNNNKISYNNYRSIYLSFASKYAVEGPLSLDTINTILYYMNSEYLDIEELDRLQNCEYLPNNSEVVDVIKEAIDEINKYNINM